MTKKMIVGLIALLALAGASFAEYASFQDAMKGGADLLFKQKAYADAQVVFETAKTLSSKTKDLAKADVKIGVCLIKQKKVEEGIALIKSVLAADHSDFVNFDACVSLGDVYAFRLKDNEMALKYFNQALTYSKVGDKQKAGVQTKIDKFSN